MTTQSQTFKPSPRSLIGALWLFAILNYIYCDVLALHDPVYLAEVLTADIGGIEMNQGFILGASVLMTIPMSATLVIRIAPRALARWWSAIAGIIMTLVQVTSLNVGSEPTMSYVYFSVIEIATTAAIAWLSITKLRTESVAVPAAVPASAQVSVNA